MNKTKYNKTIQIQNNKKRIFIGGKYKLIKEKKESF